MEASTMDPKLRHPVPSLTLNMKQQDGTKVFTQTAKAKCLAESFFSQVSNTDLGDIGHTAFLELVAFPSINIEEI